MADEEDPSFVGMGLEGSFEVRDGFQKLSDIYLQTQDVRLKLIAVLYSHFLLLDSRICLRRFTHSSHI